MTGLVVHTDLRFAASGRVWSWSSSPVKTAQIQSEWSQFRRPRQRMRAISNESRAVSADISAWRLHSDVHTLGCDARATHFMCSYCLAK